MKWIKASGCMLRYDPTKNWVWGHGCPHRMVRAISMAVTKGSIPEDFSCLIMYDQDHPGVPIMLRGPNLVTYMVAGPAPRESQRTLSDIIDS